MRILLFTIFLIVLFLLDAWITSYLVENFDGQELNPYLDTSSFTSILFSPAHFLVLGVAIICLIYAEKNRSRLKLFMSTQSIRLWPFFFPSFFAITKTLAIINNLFPLFERSTPIHWLRQPFSRFSDDPSTQLIGVLTVAAILLLPLLILIANALYGERAAIETRARHDKD